MCPLYAIEQHDVRGANSDARTFAGIAYHGPITNFPYTTSTGRHTLSLSSIADDRFCTFTCAGARSRAGNRIHAGFGAQAGSAASIF
jgi:hypothetical protein